MSRQKPTIREIFCTDPSTREPAAQEEYERNFYTRLKLPNDVYKTTHERRLDDVNRIVDDLLPTDRPVRLLDVGISSGISTMEWLDALRSAGIDAHIVGGDLDVVGHLISVGPKIDILVDRKGHVLQIDIGSRSITNHLRYPLARRALLAAPAWCANAAFKMLWLLNPALRRHIAAGGGEFTSSLGIRCRPLSLLSPRIRPNPAVEIIEDDIVANTQRFEKQFDAIRAANVLNSYLDPGMLAKMLHTLKSRLRVGGLLVICRTDLRQQNAGSVFRLTESRALELVRRIGNGSELEPFALSGGDAATLVVTHKPKTFL